MKKIAKIILMNNQNELLLQLRDNRPDIISPGQWSILGGACELNETVLAALNRELTEEIPGCFFENIEFIGVCYVEIDPDDLKVVGYSVDKDYEIKNKGNNIQELHIFKGKINEPIEHINKKLTEGQRAAYVGIDKIDGPQINNFLKDFINENKIKLFN